MGLPNLWGQMPDHWDRRLPDSRWFKECSEDPCDVRREERHCWHSLRNQVTPVQLNQSQSKVWWGKSKQSQKDSHSMQGWWDLLWVRHSLTGVRLHPHLSLIYCINISWRWMAVKGAGSDWTKGRRSPQQSERLGWAEVRSLVHPPTLPSWIPTWC